MSVLNTVRFPGPAGAGETSLRSAVGASERAIAVGPIMGIVTIGQTPRPDLERAFLAHAPGATVMVRGALDGVNDRDIDALAALPTGYPLLVRLAGGSTREIALESLHPLVSERARELAGVGARVVVVACAGGFPDVECDVPVLLPGRLLPAVVSAVTRAVRLGVVTPNRAQVPAAVRKWSNDGFDPVVTWASAHSGPELEAACVVLSDPSLSLVVLDCFGHDDNCAREFAARTGKVVLAARSVTARIAGEMVRA
jgi:protein AroM